MIKVLYFASLRERLNKESEEVEWSEAFTNLASLARQLQSRGDVWDEVFGGQNTLMMALNQEMARPDTPVQDGDEVAFFPPVTGG